MMFKERTTAVGVKSYSYYPAVFHHLDVTKELWKDRFRTNYQSWIDHMNVSLKESPESWEHLLSDFTPMLPTDTSQPLATGTGGQPLAAKGKEFTKYFAFYDWQVRLCVPVCPKWASVDDYWSLQTDKLSWIYEFEEGALDDFLGDEWWISKLDWHWTGMWDSIVVDWDEWARTPSSMLHPKKHERVTRSRSPAVGGRRCSERQERHYFVRRPWVVNFPAFVGLLGKEFTGTEIIEAWEKMPLVKPGRANRGNQNGLKRCPALNQEEQTSAPRTRGR